MSRPPFPFPAVVGMDRVREALLLAAVEPRLKGVLIAGRAGGGKSVLARTFPSLVGEGTPFVEVPLGATEDHLAGSLDIELALGTGRRQVAGGLLSRAHRGVLHVDDISLLDCRLLNRIVDALNTGVVHVEGETHTSEFMLIGTYGEGEPIASLVDSVGVHVSDASRLSQQQRVAVLERVDAFERDPARFVRQHAAATARLKERIAAARERLPQVDLSLNQRRRLSLAALELGVEGHRGDHFAVLLARARAALMGHAAVEEDDLNAAVELVLLPRAVPAVQHRETLPDGRGSETAAGDAAENLVIEPVDTAVPEGVLEARGRKTPGRRRGGETLSWTRGRYLRAVAARPGASTIALEATLRAAARHIGNTGIRVEASDLRFKQFKQSCGLLIVFAVDASGSMAYHRIHQAKGAVLRLLRQAYLHRDQVAVVSFRGDRAEVALPPSRSVERASRAIDTLAVGGGTPLTAGLEAALGLVNRAQRDTLLVLLTDGRANVGRNPAEVCAALRAAAVSSVVIDTRQRFSPGGEAERLAQLLDGRHVYLPRGDVYETVRGQIDCLRNATR